MKKKLDTEAIKNELAGSVFFPRSTITEQGQTLSIEKEPTTSDTVIPRHRDTKQPSNHNTIMSSTQDDVIEIVRKAVRQVGKEAATQRLTLEEKQALADIEYSYKRQGMRTSGNEITRIAINYVIDDYRKNGEHSLLAKVLKRLNS
jgi:hypothetical protein